MSSKYVMVTDKEKLCKYYEAGVLYYSYGGNDFMKERMSEWRSFYSAWQRRRDGIRWDSYVLIEEDGGE